MTMYMLINIKVLFTKSLDIIKRKKNFVCLINTYVMFNCLVFKSVDFFTYFSFNFNGRWPSKFFALCLQVLPKPSAAPMVHIKQKKINRSSL